MLIRSLALSGTTQGARRLARFLEAQGVRARPLSARENLWESLRTEPVDLLAVERLAITGSAAAFIGDVRALPGAPEVIVFAHCVEPEQRAELQAAHSFAVIDTDNSEAEIAHALGGVVERLVETAHRKLLTARAANADSLGDIATKSRAMREFLSFVRRVVDSDSTLLVQGETGVGKEFLSRAIHADSPRSAAPFVPVNCMALSESLLESELFGHVEGAFTGASRGRKGYFEMAHGGTLFLDEIGEMRPQTQVKLLRVLQDKRVQPVGSTDEIEVDVRLIAATNRDLSAEVAAGRFRSDLFYRLSVVELEVPALRDRQEDIPDLFESHVESLGISMNRTIHAVREDALELLAGYRWPGNVRELINVAERAVLLCRGTVITPSDLPEEIRGGPGPSLTRLAGAGDEPASERSRAALLATPFKQARSELLEAFERSYVEALLEQSRGRINEAARAGGLHTRSLYAKMRRLGIRKERFKPS